MSYAANNLLFIQLELTFVNLTCGFFGLCDLKDSEDHIDASEPLRKMKESHDKLINTINLKFNDPALDIDNLVPRKGNWDIKRSLAPKLERLERRTQRAIIRIAQKTKETKRLNEPELPDTSSDEEDDTGA